MNGSVSRLRDIDSIVIPEDKRRRNIRGALHRLQLLHQQDGGDNKPPRPHKAVDKDNASAQLLLR